LEEHKTYNEVCEKQISSLETDLQEMKQREIDIKAKFSESNSKNEKLQNELQVLQEQHNSEINEHKR